MQLSLVELMQMVYFVYLPQFLLAIAFNESSEWSFQSKGPPPQTEIRVPSVSLPGSMKRSKHNLRVAAFRAGETMNLFPGNRFSSLLGQPGQVMRVWQSVCQPLRESQEGVAKPTAAQSRALNCVATLTLSWVHPAKGSIGSLLKHCEHPGPRVLLYLDLCH